MNANTNPSLPEDLARLSGELEQAFRAERALCRASMTHAVMARLPRQAPVAVRAARMLTAVILLGAFGTLALAVQFAAARCGLWHPMTVLRVVLACGTAVVAVFMAFAAPQILVWESRILSRACGRPIRPRPIDLVLARAGALAILLAGGMILM